MDKFFYLFLLSNCLLAFFLLFVNFTSLSSKLKSDFYLLPLNYFSPDQTLSVQVLKFFCTNIVLFTVVNMIIDICKLTVNVMESPQSERMLAISSLSSSETSTTFATLKKKSNQSIKPFIFRTESFM